MARTATRLEALDSDVPLPSGTEVTPRVDRLVGDKHVSQGAVGRVVGRDGARTKWRSRGSAALDSARARSILPEEPPNRDAIEAWLVALRRQRFD